MEGAHCYEADRCDRTGPRPAGREYDHSQGCAIVGGFVGRDPAEPQLYGGYLFGDSCSGNIWALDAAKDGAQTARLVLASDRTISSFGEDEAGRLYLTDLASGDLFRIVPPAVGLDRLQAVGAGSYDEGGSRLLRPTPALPPWG